MTSRKLAQARTDLHVAACSYLSSREETILLSAMLQKMIRFREHPYRPRNSVTLVVFLTSRRRVTQKCGKKSLILFAYQHFNDLVARFSEGKYDNDGSCVPASVCELVAVFGREMCRLVRSGARHTRRWIIKIIAAFHYVSPES